jgi:hypothetical protein
MLYPAPRVDRWDPWIAALLLAALAAAATTVHLLW